MVYCTPAPTMAPTYAPSEPLENIYKEWWFWVTIGIIVLVIIFVIRAVSCCSNDEEGENEGNVDEEEGNNV